jgi:hypothetical protein
MRSTGILIAGLMLMTASSASANMLENGTFDDEGLNTTDTSINGTTGPFGDWLALDGHWTLSSGRASNTTDYAENPDYNYILMQGIDLTGYTSAFDSTLSFDYFYEAGFGGLDGRGVRVFGMDASDTVQIFFSGTTFDDVADDLLFSQELSTTGDPDAPGATFADFTSTAFTIDPTQYSALLVAFTFGGNPGDDLRAVDNVVLTGPASVPEPSVLALMAVGLVGIGFARIKKN